MAGDMADSAAERVPLDLDAWIMSVGIRSSAHDRNLQWQIQILMARCHALALTVLLFALRVAQLAQFAQVALYAGKLVKAAASLLCHFELIHRGI